MSHFRQDLRFSLRLLVKSPGFTAVAVLTLAIAIGVNSAIFSMVNGLLLRPVVPYKAEEVVGVFTTKKDAGRDFRQFSYAEYASLRESSEVFKDVAAVNFSLAGVGRDEGMKRSIVFMVSENFFSLLGVKPAAGRFFTAEESRPNANQRVIVVSYTLWQRNGAAATSSAAPFTSTVSRIPSSVFHPRASVASARSSPRKSGGPSASPSSCSRARLSSPALSRRNARRASAP